ncbi:hypothetical protein DLH72_03945 [Candidatus Gracilibacteria bacterium]|nr:MAG: hypothetical protein DLH72_03945 [Candidatus Gracilibacteria bacterium]
MLSLYSKTSHSEKLFQLESEAVRGTIFKVEKNNNLATKVIVVKGVVEITKGNQDAIISNPDLEIPFIIEDSNQSINQDGFEKPLKQLEFRAFEYDDGEILVKENLKLIENDFGKIENADFSEGYFGFKDGKYFTIGIDKENEFIFDKEIKIENDKLKAEEHRLNSSKILIDKDIYKKNCLEVFAGKIINKCVKTEAEITDGYEVVLALSATENKGKFELNNTDDKYHLLKDINSNSLDLTCEKDIENAEKTPNPFIYKYDDSFWFYPNCTEKEQDDDERNPFKEITKLEKTDDYIIEFEVRGEDFRKLVEKGGEIVKIGGRIGRNFQKYDIFKIEEKKFKVYDLRIGKQKEEEEIGKSKEEIKNLEKVKKYKIIIKKEKINNSEDFTYSIYIINGNKYNSYNLIGHNELSSIKKSFKIDIIYKYLINNLKVYKKKK